MSDIGMEGAMESSIEGWRDKGIAGAMERRRERWRDLGSDAAHRCRYVGMEGVTESCWDGEM